MKNTHAIIALVCIIVLPKCLSSISPFVECPLIYKTACPLISGSK